MSRECCETRFSRRSLWAATPTRRRRDGGRRPWPPCSPTREREHAPDPARATVGSLELGRLTARLRSRPCNSCSQMTSASVRRSATSSARRCGAGRSALAESGSSSSRSPSPVKASWASDSTGRQESTQNERSSAAETASRQRDVLPIPASPSNSPDGTPRRRRLGL